MVADDESVVFFWTYGVKVFDFKYISNITPQIYINKAYNIRSNVNKRGDEI